MITHHKNDCSSPEYSQEMFWFSTLDHPHLWGMSTSSTNIITSKYLDLPVYMTSLSIVFYVAFWDGPGMSDLVQSGSDWH